MSFLLALAIPSELAQLKHGKQVNMEHKAESSFISLSATYMFTLKMFFVHVMNHIYTEADV